MINEQDHFDLTALGFTPKDIQTLYYSGEPEVAAIACAAGMLSDSGRRLALTMIQAMLTHEAISGTTPRA